MCVIGSLFLAILLYVIDVDMCVGENTFVTVVRVHCWRMCGSGRGGRVSVLCGD